jgi:hypothetical protein
VAHSRLRSRRLLTGNRIMAPKATRSQQLDAQCDKKSQE